MVAQLVVLQGKVVFRLDNLSPKMHIFFNPTYKTSGEGVKSPTLLFNILHGKTKKGGSCLGWSGYNFICKVICFNEFQTTNYLVSNGRVLQISRLKNLL